MLHFDDWLSEVRHCKPDLVSRLRSPIRRESLSAEWELIWHRHLAVRGWEFVYCATLNGTTPDFLVRAPTPLVLEIRTVFDDYRLEQDDVRVGRVLERLRPLATRPWRMELIGEMPFMSEEAVAASCVRFQEAQATGNPIVVGSLHFEIDDQVGSYSGFTVGVRVRYLSPERRVTAALHEKIAAYKAEVIGDQPFVVAICSSDQSIAVEALRTALYGREELRQLVHKETREVAKQMVVRVGGIFNDRENAHLSAVVHSKPAALNSPVVECELLHNHLASHPLVDEAFRPWPQTHWLEPNEMERMLEIRNGDPRMIL